MKKSIMGPTSQHTYLHPKVGKAKASKEFVKREQQYKSKRKKKKSQHNLNVFYSHFDLSNERLHVLNKIHLPGLSKDEKGEKRKL